MSLSDKRQQYFHEVTGKLLRRSYDQEDLKQSIKELKDDVQELMDQTGYILSENKIDIVHDLIDNIFGKELTTEEGGKGV